MKQKIKVCWLLVLAFSVFVSGCSILSNSKESESQVHEQEVDISPELKFEKLIEDKRIYEQDEDENVIHLYLTVVDDTTNNTEALYELNNWYFYNEFTTDSPKLNVIVQEGTADGPIEGYFGYGEKTANATMAIRGASNRAAVQKSYKLKLFENAGLWNGQTTLNLNKHSYDFLRVRNKLSFDYFKKLSNFTSLRTQFVHLHVKDLTSASSNEEFEDYGLYTHIEQPNKRFLASRGLDPNGQLYKATMFEFYRYEEEIKLATDPDYDEKAFETVLEIKGSKDHSKLISMLDDVNNLNLDINTVIEKHFDRDNYLTWLAVNFLMGNIDTNSQNFYLYSPLNSEKFFFLPWDYDGAWGNNDGGGETIGETTEWQKGISNYWGVVLHQRFFKDTNNVKDLSKKIEELSKIINKENTKELLDSYYPIVSKYVKSSPDMYYLPNDVEHFDQLYQDLINEIDKNIKLFNEKLEYPMPIYLADTVREEEDMYFEWDYSYDLQGDNITYDLQISDSVDFSTIYIEKNNLTENYETVPLSDLKEGRNYWRVLIKDSKGHLQEAFDRIEGDDIFYNGVREFYVE